MLEGAPEFTWPLNIPCGTGMCLRAAPTAPPDITTSASSSCFSVRVVPQSPGVTWPSMVPDVSELLQGHLISTDGWWHLKTRPRSLNLTAPGELVHMELQSPLNPWGFRALLMATWCQRNKNDFQHLKSITASLKAMHCVFLCSGLSAVFSSISSISPALSNSVQTCQEIQLRRLENADARGDSSDHFAQHPPCFYLFVFFNR